MKTITIAAMLLVAFSSPVLAQDIFEQSRRGYERGQRDAERELSTERTCATSAILSKSEADRVPRTTATSTSAVAKTRLSVAWRMESGARLDAGIKLRDDEQMFGAK
jgi:hypothetical protein